MKPQIYRSSTSQKNSLILGSCFAATVRSAKPPPPPHHHHHHAHSAQPPPACMPRKYPYINHSHTAWGPIREMAKVRFKKIIIKRTGSHDGDSQKCAVFAWSIPLIHGEHPLPLVSVSIHHPQQLKNVHDRSILLNIKRFFWGGQLRTIDCTFHGECQSLFLSRFL